MIMTKDQWPAVLGMDHLLLFACYEAKVIKWYWRQRLISLPLHAIADGLKETAANETIAREM